MSRTKKSAKSSGDNRFVDYREIRWVLNSLSKSQLDELDAGDVDTWKGAQILIDRGFKISLRWDDYSSCYQATAVNNNADDSENGGYGVSGRGLDAEDAVNIVVYKILVIADGTLSGMGDNISDSMRG